MSTQINIQEILKKKVSELTPEEKQLLREWFLSHRSRRSIGADLRRSSSKVPVYVATWVKHPGRYDIPGVDTPETTKSFQGLKRIYKVLATSKGVYVNGKFYGWGDIEKILEEDYPSELLVYFKQKANEHGYNYPVRPAPAYKLVYKSGRPRFAIYLVKMPRSSHLQAKYLVTITYNVGQSIIRTKGIFGNTPEELIKQIQELKHLKPSVKERIINKIKQLLNE